MSSSSSRRIDPTDDMDLLVDSDGGGPKHVAAAKKNRAAAVNSGRRRSSPANVSAAAAAAVQREEEEADSQQDKNLIHEGFSTRLYRIRFRRDSLPAECLAAGSNSVVAKVLKVDDPNPTDVGALYNEHDVLTGPLKNCTAARAVIGPKTKFDGRPAINLAYVEGTTLGGWARMSAGNVHYFGRDGRVDDALHIAVEVVSAVAAIHAAGVVHNDLTIENVIIGHRAQAPQAQATSKAQGKEKAQAQQQQQQETTRRVVKIIDFGSAVANPTSHSAEHHRAGRRESFGGGDMVSRRRRSRSRGRGSRSSPRTSPSPMGRRTRTSPSPMGRMGRKHRQRSYSDDVGRSGEGGGGVLTSAVSVMSAIMAPPHMSRVSSAGAPTSTGGVALSPAAVKRDLASLGTLLCKLLTGKPTPVWADQVENNGVVDVKTPSSRALVGGGGVNDDRSRDGDQSMGAGSGRGAGSNLGTAGRAAPAAPRLSSPLFPSGVVPPNLTWIILDLLAHSPETADQWQHEAAVGAGGGAAGGDDANSSLAGSTSLSSSHGNVTATNDNTVHPSSSQAGDGGGGGTGNPAVQPCYMLAAEVERDLRLIQDDDKFLRVPPPVNPTDPLGLLAAAASGNSSAHGAGGRKLYGRAAEEAKLRAVYGRIRSGRSCSRGGAAVESGGGDEPQQRSASAGAGTGGGISENDAAEIVLISGGSGTGKTALAQTVMRDLVLGDGGFFLTGKFDQIHKTAYSAFIAAFSKYCDRVIDGDEGELLTIGESIRDSVGSELRLLTDIIPALEGIIGKQVDDPGEGKGELQTQAYRLRYVFGHFIRAVAEADPHRPVALFLDDLQWADSESLQLIESLLGNPSFFLIGTYRNDEIDPDHLLLSDLGNANVTRIEISSLMPDSINDMISDLLHLPRQLTHSRLTGNVYGKTYGNVFHVIQFLQTLCDEGVLSYSMEDEWWRWDLEGIKSMAITENVVHLLEKKIQRFSDEAQEALKVAACLGSQFGTYPLKLVLNKDVERSLFRALNDGLVSTVVPGKEYRFTHDKIQQAAYNLIPEEEQGAFHLRIGRLLWKNATDKDLEGDFLFAIANQLNLGSSNVKDNADRTDLARINLKAGKRAMETSAFAAAAAYLSNGIQIMEGLQAKAYYGLSLALFNAAAEAEFVNGHFDRMEEYIQFIFSHSQSFYDKLPAHVLCVNSLGVRALLPEAIDMGLYILQKLRVPFPSNIRPTHVLKGFIKTKWMLRGKSDHDILSLPTMHSPDTVAAMQILHLLFVYSIIARENLIPLIVFQMIQMTLKHGLAAGSSYGFSSYGTILCSVLGNSKEGYRCGLIALAIVEKFSAKEMKPRVYASVYGTITIWSDHLEGSLPPLLDGHRIGLECGDVESSGFNANQFLMISFAAGHLLLPLEEQAKSFCRQMVSHKQETCLSVTLPIWQTMQNLIGPSKTPTTLTGDVMDQEDLLKKYTDSGNLSAVCSIYYHRLLLACIFGDYQLAVDMAEKSRNIDKAAMGLCVIFNHAFYEGIAALALAQDNQNRRKMLKVAKQSMKKMTKWARQTPQNCNHKLMLLTAEQFAAQGDRERAIHMYDQSINSARYEGFLHDQALASERAAKYSLLGGNKRGATDYAKLSHSLYAEWGAKAKAEQLHRDFFSSL